MIAARKTPAAPPGAAGVFSSFLGPGVGGWAHHLSVGSAWHPIFLTSEPSPGLWVMRASHDVEAFGRIELRRVDGGLRYKVTLGGEVIGWAASLEVACVRLWDAYRRDRQRVYGGPPNGLRGSLPH